MFELIWVWIGFLGYWNGLRADLRWLFWLFGLVCGLFFGFFGEFDPGSGRTLAACLTHASRTERPTTFGGGYSSGERVSNTWVICPALWDKPGKLGLIPHTTTL